MKAINIGIIGLGTVGCGVVNVLHRNREEISRRAGRNIFVTHCVVQDVQKERGCVDRNFTLTTDATSVTDNPNIDIVIELVGGVHDAAQLVDRALTQNKHVVTANKALIAERGNEIFRLARSKGLTVAFEAAVGGGISVIKVLREGLAGNRINRIAGIINGTSNYVLTEMFNSNIDFATALSNATRLGYAERDPSADIGGKDAAHKLTILASIAYGMPLKFSDVYIEGIEGVTLDDMIYANELNYSIKHLCLAIRRPNGIELRTHPCLIKKDELLSNINGVMNAIQIDGDAVGSSLHYGSGAGAEPTASAIVADIIDVVRTLTIDPDNRVPHLAFQEQAMIDLPILDMSLTTTPFYLRLSVIDKPGVLADITQILGRYGISIEAIWQKGTSPQGQSVPIVIITHEAIEKSVMGAITEIEQLTTVNGLVQRIRLEPFTS